MVERPIVHEASVRSGDPPPRAREFTQIWQFTKALEAGPMAWEKTDMSEEGGFATMTS